MTKNLVKGAWYTVTTATTCNITDANGTLLGTAEAGKQLNFQATTELITFSDPAATVLSNPNFAPAPQSGGGEEKAVLEQANRLESELFENWEEENVERESQFGVLQGMGTQYPVFHTCFVFTYETKVNYAFNDVTIAVKLGGEPTLLVNGVKAVYRSHVLSEDYCLVTYRLPKVVEGRSFEFRITGASEVGGGPFDVYGSTVSFGDGQEWGYYPFAKLRLIQVEQCKGVKERVYRIFATDENGNIAPMELSDDFRDILRSIVNGFSLYAWGSIMFDWGTLTCDDTAPVLLGFTFVTSQYEEFVKEEMDQVIAMYHQLNTGFFLKSVRVR